MEPQDEADEGEQLAEEQQEEVAPDEPEGDAPEERPGEATINEDLQSDRQQAVEPIAQPVTQATPEDDYWNRFPDASAKHREPAEIDAALVRIKEQKEEMMMKKMQRQQREAE